MKFLPVVPVFLFLAACAVIWAVPPGFASAQSNVSINDHGVENQFPDGLRFHISASSESRIEEIRVYVRKLGQSNRSSYRSVEFEPGQSISGEVLFRSKTANEYIPTGTHLSYYFQILTADGASTETEPQSVVYLNTGLDWQTASAGLINVYYYHHNDQSETRANAVLNVAAGTYEFMAPILGVELTEPMSIVVYSDYSHMLDALQPASRVAAQRLRTLGKAFTNERTLLVDGSLSNILSTAAHEFTHLLVADAAGSAYTGVDSWLNEGLAVYSERDPDSEFNRYIARAIQRNDVPPLTGLATFAGTPDETLRNYGQGYSVVSFMLDTYGPNAMADLFAVLRTLRSTEKAVAAVYELTIHELDNQWRQSVGLPVASLATPALPPLQVPATSRPNGGSPTAIPPAANESATATPPPVAQVAPTYTSPPPTLTTTDLPTPAAGCYAPVEGSHAGIELSALALLTLPVGLGSLLAIRRRRE